MVQSIWFANNKTKYIFYHKQLVCMRTTLPSNDMFESDERKCPSVNTSEGWRQLSPACVLLAAETVRAMTHVINQGMAMYWGTSRWSPMEIMVRLSAIRYSHWLLIISLDVWGSLMEHIIPFLGGLLSGETIQPDSSHLWAGWVPHVSEREGGGATTWALP